MKDEPSVDHTLQEEPPNETDRNVGMFTAGVIALAVIGMTIYWIA